MESSSSTSRPAVSVTTGRQQNQAVDETLAHIDELLNVLNGAASFLPGAGAVVPALQSIVGQIRVSVKRQSCLLFLNFIIENTYEWQDCERTRRNHMWSYRIDQYQRQERARQNRIFEATFQQRAIQESGVI
jgi:hypothetical protein